MKRWAVHFPILISGGLPGSGVKDLAYLLKFRIEEAIYHKAQLGGFTFDLRKAFNTFPRWPITFLWSRLGVPSWVCSFWIKSLMRMRRYQACMGSLGRLFPPLLVPPSEGESLSVLAMLALARAFHDNISCEEVALHGMMTIGGGRPLILGPIVKPFSQH